LTPVNLSIAIGSVLKEATDTEARLCVFLPNGKKGGTPAGKKFYHTDIDDLECLPIAKCKMVYSSDVVWLQ